MRPDIDAEYNSVHRTLSPYLRNPFKHPFTAHLQLESKPCCSVTSHPTYAVCVSTFRPTLTRFRTAVASSSSYFFGSNSAGRGGGACWPDGDTPLQSSSSGKRKTCSMICSTRRRKLSYASMSTGGGCAAKLLRWSPWWSACNCCCLCGRPEHFAVQWTQKVENK